MISREEVLHVVREAGCLDDVIQHILAVERVALSIAEIVKANGYEIDIGLVSLGSLVHDIGRTVTHAVNHGVEGAKILRRMGLGDLAHFAERHVGSGIPASEAKELGMPEKDLVPVTLEEKVVTYADKLTNGCRKDTYERALQCFKSKLGLQHPAVDRFRRLHEEIHNMIGNK